MQLGGLPLSGDVSSLRSLLLLVLCSVADGVIACYFASASVLYVVELVGVGDEVGVIDLQATANIIIIRYPQKTVIALMQELNG